MKRCIAYLMLVSVFADCIRAAEQTTATKPAGSFEVVEWVIVLVDPNRPLANEAAAFKSTAPAFARGRRAASDAANAATRPSPVGVIRIMGTNGASGGPIDVLLQSTGGKFLGSWPEGKPRSNRVLWENISLHEGRVKPITVDRGHWFEILRGRTDSNLLSSSRWSERFLMYDAEIPYRNVVRIQQATDGYRLATAGVVALRDVEVYAPAEKGWRVGSLPELPSTAPPHVAATEPVIATAADASHDVFVDSSPRSKPSATGPTTKPATAPAEPTEGAWRNLKLSDAVTTDPLSGQRTRLKEADLTPADIETILATLQAHALDTEQLSIVYRIESSELDRLLPLEIIPAPAKTTRVGLAIVKGIDPAASDRIAKLIQQLGDPDWSKREAAHVKLGDIGVRARPKLTEALRSSDVEIAYRAERLLAAMNAQ